VRTAVHGMPRIGDRRALKWALEDFWSGTLGAEELGARSAAIRRRNWQLLAKAGVNFPPCNDFSLYDHVLDAALAVGAVPDRFHPRGRPVDLATYFAMARGGTLDGVPVSPLELTKWFDTNYHHLVPEIGPDTVFAADATKAIGELAESAALGIATVPVLLGPLTLLLRSAPAEPGFDVLSRLDAVCQAYADLLGELQRHGATWVRLDEPSLVEDRGPGELEALRVVYEQLAGLTTRPNIVLATYFGHVGDAIGVLRDIAVEAVGLDFCCGPQNLDLLRRSGGLAGKVLFAGVVDGRNVWVNDLEASLSLLEALDELADEVVASTSCSLMHVPLSTAEEGSLDPEIRPWLSFAEEKLAELEVLGRAMGEGRQAAASDLEANRAVLEARRASARVTDPAVRRALADAPPDPRRRADLQTRARLQQDRLDLPLLPTTTIGSFPQTAELRRARAARRSGRITEEEYRDHLRAEVDRAVTLQEQAGLDLLVHGEPERDDMVRHFAARLTGFVLPDQGWVQSYGSRCVRPPVLFGDVVRPRPMTVEWATYANARTNKAVKGILTGPVTILRWSFVRDDQPEADTAAQLGLAIRHELVDLQQAGIAAIQVDEPALREGLPLRREAQTDYLAWAVRAFRLVTSAADPAVQVHTHMCYTQLGDVVDVLGDLDVDVVSLEAARSRMRFLDALAAGSYRGGLGPGLYDVHSTIVPEESELEALLRIALESIGSERLWVNPDCGLKTRTYEDVGAALPRMVNAARRLRAEL
jgi:5-methyltetrahydropteroyltriglutamate--homocysteine methyltransferase